MIKPILSGQNNAVDFDDLCNLFVELESCNAPAELHGIMCGQLAAGKRLSANEWIALAIEQMQLSELPDAARAMLQAFYDQTLKQLLGGEFGLRLLLPDEEDEIEIRAEALGQWCHGFLGGFGLASPKADALSEEVVGVLQDFAEIAQIQLDMEESEENEVSLMEVSEYVRMGALVVFSECNPEAPVIKPPSTSLH
ncbi:UPF0149 family protein [Aestuariirhabdus sp. Z084]|uniref:UPF0149 family protein n=1 Tax=Aestuariirhabdus haliotis TaxID=2918751 RepID=UPI00201B42D0|nr:UPF0149 family protein [Aestuariirhabdus haliotis]MCL6415686.1 UPF0149 family protein [Aestuariirhabdus haliotis]MCL6419788.1 UPF0149 family protein [Aestuariirhabdus haliotis]